jgi:branched-chain amino acid transport system substrate-binding protein
MRPFFTVCIVFGVILGIMALAVACGDDDDGSSATPTASSGSSSTATATAAADETEPGAAGIASDPRAVEGFDNWKLDDGIAMFASRPSSEDRTGVTDDSIKICQPISQTGSGAIYGPYLTLMQEDINRINAAGGIHGRQLDWSTRDDASDATQATQIDKELVENDGCFLIFGQKGSAIVSAQTQYMEEQGVPYFMVGASATTLGEPGYPNALSATLSVTFSTYAFATQIFADNPGQKLAIMYQNDDYGKSGLTGFETAASQTNGQIVAKIPFDATAVDISGELNEVVNSGADGFVGIGLPPAWPKFVTGLRQTLGSDMAIYDPGGLSALAGDFPDKDTLLDGVIAFNSAAEQLTSSNQSVQEVNSILQAAGTDPNQFAITYGQSDIEHLARVLECAGPDLTREGFIQAMNRGCLDGSWQCTVCLAPSIVTPDDRWAFESLQYTEYDPAAHTFVANGDPVIKETSAGDGIRGNLPGFECSDALPCPWNDGCTTEDRCAWQPDVATPSAWSGTS